MSAADLWAAYGAHESLRQFTKPALMPALAVVACAVPGRFDRARVLLLAALAWSGVGDVVLLSRSDAAFAVGTIAFALAHVAYIASFASLGGGRGLVRRCPWIVLVYLAGWVAATLVVAPHMGALAVVAVPYSLVLTIMALCALDLVGRIVMPGALLAAAGAAIFMSSDTDIALGRFDPSLAPPHVEFVIMLTYLVAQACIVAGITRAGRERG